MCECDLVIPHSSPHAISHYLLVAQYSEHYQDRNCSFFIPIKILVPEACVTHGTTIEDINPPLHSPGPEKTGKEPQGEVTRFSQLHSQVG